MQSNQLSFQKPYPQKRAAGIAREYTKNASFFDRKPTFTICSKNQYCNRSTVLLGHCV